MTLVPKVHICIIVLVNVLLEYLQPYFRINILTTEALNLNLHVCAECAWKQNAFLVG